MRREPTDVDHKLWQTLHSRRLDGIKFRHQYNLDPYIVDFVCLSAKLIVELDGSQHAESGYDAIRDAELKRRGFRVLRFWNEDVSKDLAGVCDTVIAYARDASLQPWR